MQAGGQENSRQLVAGVAVALLWGLGLFGVLEAEPLLAKVVVLACLAPMSLALDYLLLLLAKDRRPDSADRTLITHLKAGQAPVYVAVDSTQVSRRPAA